MKITSIADINWDDVRALKPFNTFGNFTGVTYTHGAGRLRGHALKVWEGEVNNIDYVIYSYATPVAWHTPYSGWRVVVDSFSMMTSSRHQSQLWQLSQGSDVVTEVGFRWNWLSPAQVNMLIQLRDKTRYGRDYIIPRGQEQRTLSALLRGGHVVTTRVHGRDGYRLSPVTAERIAR